jgi:hypothetical protein
MSSNINETGKQPKQRKVYLCSKCGLPLKGHKCLAAADSNDSASLSLAKRDEFPNNSARSTKPKTAVTFRKKSKNTGDENNDSRKDKKDELRTSSQSNSSSRIAGSKTLNIAGDHQAASTTPRRQNEKSTTSKKGPRVLSTTRICPRCKSPFHKSHTCPPMNKSTKVPRNSLSRANATASSAPRNKSSSPPRKKTPPLAPESSDDSGDSEEEPSRTRASSSSKNDPAGHQSRDQKRSHKDEGVTPRKRTKQEETTTPMWTEIMAPAHMLQDQVQEYLSNDDNELTSDARLLLVQWSGAVHGCLTEQNTRLLRNCELVAEQRKIHHQCQKQRHALVELKAKIRRVQQENHQLQESPDRHERNRNASHFMSALDEMMRGDSQKG